MKRIILTILLICVCVRPCCRAQNTINQVLITEIPQAIDITVLDTASTGVIYPETGRNSGPHAAFNIKTNVSDSEYDFILKASVTTQEGTQENAYGLVNSSPVIVLGNVSLGNYPTILSVNNAKNSTIDNPNAIAYQVSYNVSDFNEMTFQNDPNYGGNLFKILVGDKQNGNVSTRILNNPVNNTYNYAEDKPGIYEAVLVLTAFRKP